MLILCLQKKLCRFPDFSTHKGDSQKSRVRVFGIHKGGGDQGQQSEETHLGKLKDPERVGMSGFNPRRNEEMSIQNMLSTTWETDTKEKMTGQQGIDKMKVCFTSDRLHFFALNWQ